MYGNCKPDEIVCTPISIENVIVNNTDVTIKTQVRVECGSDFELHWTSLAGERYVDVECGVDGEWSYNLTGTVCGGYIIVFFLVFESYFAAF